MQDTRDALEQRQIPIYFAAVALAAVAAWALPGTGVLERAINPALALMLYVTFLQVPLAELRRAFGQVRFLAALMTANFIVVPLLVWALLQFLPADPCCAWARCWCCWRPASTTWSPSPTWDAPMRACCWRPRRPC